MPLFPTESTLAIVNPVSGRGRSQSLLSRLPAGVPVQKTTRPGEAEEIARAAVSAGKQLIIAVGGDGTVSEVLNGLRPDSSLAILPAGTGNDLAGHLGIASFEQGLETLNTGQPVQIDLGEWATPTPIAAQGRRFANVVGCGFDASVAARINQGFRWVRGTTAYVLAVLSTLRSFQPRQMTIRVDDEEFQTEAMLCSIANTQRYGGGMRIAPSASVIDGLLDVVIVERVSKAEFLKTFPKVFKGRHASHPRVKILRGTDIQVTPREALPILWDGEIFGTTPLHVKAVPAALSVLVPSGSNNL